MKGLFSMLNEKLQKIANLLDLKIECGNAGNTNASLVILLDSPSESDVKINMPLSTASGQMVFRILEKYNIKRSDCYITCAIKRKLPMFQDKFKITGTELINWRNILETEFEDLPNVKYVLCLGKYAMQIFTNETSIVDWRGSVVPHTIHMNTGTKDVKLLFTFNPIMIYREPKWEAIFKFDLYKLHSVFT